MYTSRNVLRLTTGLYYNNHLKVDVNVMLCFKAYYFEKIYTVFFVYPKSSKTGFFCLTEKMGLVDPAKYLGPSYV